MDTAEMRKLGWAMFSTKPSLGARDEVWHQWQACVNSIANAYGIARTTAYDDYLDICFGRKA